MRPVTIAYENSSDTFEILDKDAQTKDNVLKNSQDTPESRKLPLPRDLDQNNEGEIKSFTFSQELQDPGSPNSITIVTETTSDKNYPFNNSYCDFSNRYRYCKEVIKPCLKDDPPDCPSSIELLLKNAIKKTTAEFPEKPPYLICHRCKPPPSCPPKPKCCKPKNRLKICCGIDGTRTICKECTKANCPSFVRPKPYVPPCSPPLPCPPVCRPPCPLPACPPPCPPPPCPPRCSPPPCPPKCPPPPCPPKCPPPPCPPPPCPPRCPPPPCPPPPCPPPPCPPKCPPPACPPRCPPPPCPPRCPPPPCPPPPCPPRCPPPPCPPPPCPPPPCPPKCPPPPCPPPQCPPRCPPPPCPPPPCPPRCPPPPCPPRCPPPPCPSPPRCPPPPCPSPPRCPPPPCPPKCPPPPCPPPPCPPRCPPPPCPPPPCPPRCPPPPCPPPPCPPKCPPRCPPPPCPPKCPPRCPPPPCPPKCPPPPCPPPPCPPKCPPIPCRCSQHSKSNVTKIVSCVKSLVGLGGQKFDCNCGAKECVAPKPKPCPPPPPYCPQPPSKCPEARSAKKFLCSSENPNSQNDLNAKPIENNSSSCCSNNLPPIVIAQEQQMGCIKCALTDNNCEEDSSQEASAALKNGVEGNVESLNNSIDLTNSKRLDGQKIPVKVSNSHKDAGPYNVVQLDNLDAEEKFLGNEQRQSNTRPDNSGTNFILDKIESAVSMISDTLDYELPRPIKSKSFFKQNCEIPTASQPQTPTGVSNIMMGSYNLFSSIQEAIFSMFNEDDHTTVSSRTSSSTSLASESDENILSKMID